MFLQGIPGCMPWGMISVYLNDYLHVDNKAPTVLDATAIEGGLHNLDPAVHGRAPRGHGASALRALQVTPPPDVPEVDPLPR